MAAIDEELLRVLVCPVSLAPLVQAGDWLYSTDPMMRRKYPIRDGIAILLVDESEVAERADIEQVTARREGPTELHH